MMKKTDDRNRNPENSYGIFYDNYLDTNACTECTGLMPNAPDGRGEWDAYREIFDFMPESLRPESGEDEKTQGGSA